MHKILPTVFVHVIDVNNKYCGGLWPKSGGTVGSSQLFPFKNIHAEAASSNVLRWKVKTKIRSGEPRTS